ncbi:uncharacterized protein LOC143770619 [Ranitomeya variabilis]|uniref:uncharacterized protein LOC143770619 n=1 Tax=Ranitomeya variabilis TaxID=490064 RepID=UPI004056E7D8
MVASIQVRAPLWDPCDPRHADQVVLKRMWTEVAKSLWDGFDSASPSDQTKFVKKLKTRWRSMKDRFNRGLKKEGAARSGAAAARSIPYKYNRILQFLRPALSRRQTHSSTLEPVRPSGAVLRESPSGPSQPSHSDSRLAPPSGEPAAGPSDVPLPEATGAPSFGLSRQRQRASDRPLLPEFLHLSTVFQNCFKALGDRMDTALSNIDRRLENMESELSRPAKHFFSAIAKGMVEHLTPELQISVMQACNNAYVTALQQARVMQSATTMPVVPSLASMTPTPAAEQPHQTPRAEGHRRRHHRRKPQSPAPARPSRTHRRQEEQHPEGERRKRARTSPATPALAAPIPAPSSRQGSNRSRSSQSQPTEPRTLVVPPPSPPALAFSPPSTTGWSDIGIPSSILQYGGSSSSSSTSTHSQTGGYQSPFIADIPSP